MKAAASVSSSLVASDHDMRTFFDKALGCGQAHATIAACDDRDFPASFCPLLLLICFFLLFFVVFLC